MGVIDYDTPVKRYATYQGVRVRVLSIVGETAQIMHVPGYARFYCDISNLEGFEYE